MRVRDAAFIRKLCALGLPPRSLVLALLPALRQVVPAHSGGVFWVDRSGQMTGLYAERLLPPEAMTAYYERHYDRRGEGFAAAFKQRAQGADAVSWSSFSRADQASDYFRDVLKPLDAYHVLYGILKDKGAPFAQVSLYRGESEAPFGREDAATLRGLLRYLELGLVNPDRAAKGADESVIAEEALGIVTPSGEIVSASAAWRRLVRLGALTQLAPSQAVRERAAVEDFLGELSAAARKDPRASASVTEIVRDTAWGRFTVRAFRLDDERGRRREQVALLIRREEARSLSLVRGTGNSELSPQQREVALLLAQGKTNPEIAEVLGLTLNTASYHVKQVYLRLHVNNREAVQEELLKRAHVDVAGGA
jgi:DNA-binding CsgD family transcriptional regulator